MVWPSTVLVVVTIMALLAFLRVFLNDAHVCRGRAYATDYRGLRGLRARENLSWPSS